MKLSLIRKCQLFHNENLLKVATFQQKSICTDSQQCDDHNDHDCKLTPIAEPKFCISELGWWSEAQHCDLLIVRKATLKSMHNVSWNYLNLSEHIHTYPNLYEPIWSYPNLSEPKQTYPNLFVLIWTYPKISKSIYKVSKTRISETRMEKCLKTYGANQVSEMIANSKRTLIYKATISVRSLSMQRCVINRKSLLWLPSPTLPFLYLLFWKSNGKKWSRSSRNIR